MYRSIHSFRVLDPEANQKDSSERLVKGHQII